MIGAGAIGTYGQMTRVSRADAGLSRNVGGKNPLHDITNEHARSHQRSTERGLDQCRAACRHAAILQHGHQVRQHAVQAEGQQAKDDEQQPQQWPFEQQGQGNVRTRRYGGGLWAQFITTCDDREEARILGKMFSRYRELPVVAVMNPPSGDAGLASPSCGGIRLEPCWSRS